MPEIAVIEVVVTAPDAPKVIEVAIPGQTGPEGSIGYEGAYSSGAAYSINDIVTYQGSSWVALQETEGHSPPTLPTISNSYWSLLSAKGDEGDQGGAATISVGTVTTLEPDDDATVENVGTSGAAVLNFGIPKGNTGDTGPANSLSIGTVEGGETASATIIGSAPSQTLNLVLPKGEKGDTGSQGLKGDTGDAGPANSLSIGTVEGGETAGASITGDAPSQTLNLTLPRGEKGDKGDEGPAGSNGVGVPPGGLTGQALVKTSGTNYDTEWADTAGSGITQISNVVTLSSDAACDFTGLDGTYGVYIIRLQNVIPATDDAYLMLRTSSNSGTSFDAGSSDYSYVMFGYRDVDTAQVVLRSVGAAQMAISVPVTDYGIGSNANETGLSGSIEIIRPADAKYCTVSWNISYTGSDGALYSIQGAGRRLAAADVDAVRILFSSGNIESGYASLFGVVQ
jgi:hypothetical protein